MACAGASQKQGFERHGDGGAVAVIVEPFTKDRSEESCSAYGHTAQQKLTGLVIGFLPIGVGVLFQIMSPGYIEPLFTTVIGKMLIGVAITLEVIGVMVIQRILNIEV